MLKESILKDFEENRNHPISGQSLADKYQVSRNAVWKAVNALKKEGYEIVSAPNRGYYIPDSCDHISVQGIQQHLMEPYRKLDIRVFSTIDSTNNEAKRMLAEQDIDRVLIVSNRQEKGRGRMGRDFYSPEDNGIYMTLIYKVENGIESPMLITMAAAVAVVRAVESLTAVRVGLKWVNDIFVNGKKAGGILTEATTDLETGRVEHVAVGIGLNIHQQDFPEHLQQIAASLNITEVNRNQLIGEITNQLLTLYQAMEPRDFMEEYIAHSIVIGKEVRYEKDKCMVTGQVKEIAENGALIVQNQEGEEDRILSGEILLHN